MHRHTSAPAANHPAPARARRAPASAPTFVLAFATVFVFALATAPRRAGAAIVTSSQSHLLTANVAVGDVTDSDTASGSAVGPVDARAEASVPFSTAVTTLNLSSDGTGITGRLRGTADASPAPNP